MKKSLFGLFAVAIAICAVAFTTAPKQNSVDEFYWFSYTNNVVNPILATEPTHEESPFTCSSGSYTCTRAYLPGDTETFSDGSVTKRRPKTGVTIQQQLNKSTP